ncbi:MAG: serine hydrolase [Rhodothermaceae bacterium]|nr:serine hydrolase [Rhodothermaceae bacterium]MXW32641.1 serine hydrolase [Rhodothermaceae bacterium]MYC03619.1 serine hydrolase [Rhodothermaceae bacterium]MYE62238.1 serine hydrolase [Rhodothermaceae bacterium]MYI16437.1 serine hydrolase [Rhodothermaceae bacterium]
MLILIGGTVLSCNESVTLQEKIEAVISEYPDATVAVAIRDASTQTTLDILPDRPFHAASTMKVPVQIEAWRRVRDTSLSLDSTLEVKNSFRSIVDGTPYRIEEDSDDAIYERLGERMTISDLIYQMITVSSNLATNLLIDFLEAETVQETVNSMGAPGMQVLRGVEDLKAFELGLSNSTTASALATLLEAIRQGKAVSPAADSSMVEVLVDQAFNEMIPAGLPSDVLVAHKTGQITRIHHDAAIIYPPNSPPYVLVILIEGLEDDAESAALGTEIARTTHATLRGE